MPGTLLRYIGFGGLLIIACGGLAWYKMPDLMIVVGRELLAGTDIKLVSATLARQARLPLVIDELTLRSRTETFHINNLQISPLTPWANAWRLDLEQLQVEGLDQELNTPIVTVGEWQDELMAVLPTLPEQGHIASYRYCDNGCLTGSLHWQRQASEVLAKITVQQYGAQAELLIASDELALTVVADAAKATATDSPLPVTEALGLPLPALWILNGHVSTANSATPLLHRHHQPRAIDHKLAPGTPARWHRRLTGPVSGSSRVQYGDTRGNARHSRRYLARRHVGVKRRGCWRMGSCHGYDSTV